MSTDTNMKSVAVTVRVPQAMKDQLQQMADDQHRTLSGQFCFLMDRYLKQMNMDQPALALAEDPIHQEAND